MNSCRFRLRYFYLFSLLIIAVGLVANLPFRELEGRYMEYMTRIIWRLSFEMIYMIILVLLCDAVSRIMTSGKAYYFVFLFSIFLINAAFEARIFSGYITLFDGYTQIVLAQKITPAGWRLVVYKAAMVVIWFGLPIALLEAYRRSGSRHEST